MEYEFNLNETIKVKLNDLGYELLAKEHNQYLGVIKNWDYRTADFYRDKADERGYSKFQAWNFFEKFGHTIGSLKTQHFDINILLEIKEPNSHSPT